MFGQAIAPVYKADAESQNVQFFLEFKYYTIKLKKKVKEFIRKQNHLCHLKL